MAELDIQKLREQRVEAAKAIQSHSALMHLDEDGAKFNEQGGITKHRQLVQVNKDLTELIAQAEADLAAEGETQAKLDADRRNISVDAAMGDRERQFRDHGLYVMHGRAALPHMSKNGQDRYSKPFSLRRVTGDRNAIEEGPNGTIVALGEADADFPTATDTAPGAATDGVAIATLVGQDLFTRMKSASGPRSFATVTPALTGQPRVEPTMNDTAATGEFLNPTDSASDEDMQVGGRAMVFQVGSSKVTPFNWDWMQDTSIVRMVEKINALHAIRLNRLFGAAMTKKSGKAKNNGYDDDMPIGVTLGNGGGRATGVDIEGLRALVASVDPAYRIGPSPMGDDVTGRSGQGAGMMEGRAGFSCNDDTYLKIATLKDTQNRPLLLDYDRGYAAGGMPTFLGYPFWMNQFLPKMAANARSIAFGQHSNFQIYDVVQMVETLRFVDSVYAKKRQTGLVTMIRCGWRLADDGDSIKVLVNAAND